MNFDKLNQFPIYKISDAVYHDEGEKILRGMEVIFDLTQWKDKIYNIQDVGRILYHDDVCIYFNNKEIGLEHKYETCCYDGRRVSVELKESFDDALNELAKLVRVDLEVHVKEEMQAYGIDEDDKEEYDSIKKEYDWAFESLSWVK